MNQCYLPENVYFCVTEGSSIFLDLSRNQYFGIQNFDITTLLQEHSSRSIPSPLASDACQVLLHKGLLRYAVGKPLRPILITHAAQAISDLDHEDDAPHGRSQTRLHHVKNFFLSYVLTTVTLRTCGLSSIVARAKRVRARLSSGSRHDGPNVHDIVRSFLTLRPLFYTARNHCLLDSLTLLRYLEKYRLSATWVLGVKTRPFAAHSWVQGNGVVFNDTPEYIREFTPILSV